MALDILTTGRVYADLIFSGLDAAPEPGREVFADRLVLVPGGGPFITASYISALGLTAGLWGVAPAAPFDTVVRNGLTRNRVADLMAPAPPGTDPQLTAAITGPGDRAFVTRRAGPVRPGGEMPTARHLHIGEMTSALEAPGLIAEARERGMTVSLDCGWDAGMFGDPRVAGVVAEVDLFLPNEAEWDEFDRRGVVLQPRTALIVKCGASGARALAGGEETRVPAQPAEVLDSTGAGDAFNAGVIAGWLKRRSLADCLALGAACGAVAVARLGGAEALPDLSPLTAAATV